MRLLSYCVIWVVFKTSHAVSTKMDFEEDASKNSTSDDDVELKQTIVVSTKLKNNRRGLHSGDGSGALTYSIGRSEKAKDDSGEVPVFAGYKGVESTQIWTPDTRLKPKPPQPFAPQRPPQRPPQSFVKNYPDILINRNIRDRDDIFPSIELGSWVPSNFFNNINYWGQEPLEPKFGKTDRPNQSKLHRKITEDGMKEFYCRKCREMSCQEYKEEGMYPSLPKQRPWVRTTTPKIKIDGKLAKLN